MTLVDPSASIPHIVGRRKAITVICPIDLITLGHYDNVPTITKSSTRSVGKLSYWP